MKRWLVAAAVGAMAISGATMAQDAPAPARPAPPRGGPPPTPPLGDGPWDLPTETGPVHVSVVTKGLDHPWGLAFLPGGTMLVTERAGRLRVIRNGVLDPEPVAGLPEIFAEGLGGLMDIALHPQFAKNHWVYFSYTKGKHGENSTVAVYRARWDGKKLIDGKDIFVAAAWYGVAPVPVRCCGQGPQSGSYGSRIVFDKAGYLYVTSGDRNYGEMAQLQATDIGKILRLKDDGSVPKDNPFVGKGEYLPEIWSVGHRNPLGLTMDSATGKIWESEFGPRGGDEVNVITRGGNYGWINVTQGFHYNGQPAKGIKDVPGMTDAVVAFGPPSINPGNLAIYRGGKFPAWKGNLLMGTMSKSVLRATFDDKGNVTGQERFLTELKQRFRDLRVGPDGLVYILTDETGGALLKLEPGK